MKKNKGIVTIQLSIKEVASVSLLMTIGATVITFGKIPTLPSKETCIELIRDAKNFIDVAENEVNKI